MIDVYKINGDGIELISEIDDTLKNATNQVASLFETVKIRRCQNKSYIYLGFGGKLMLSRRIIMEVKQ